MLKWVRLNFIIQKRLKSHIHTQKWWKQVTEAAWNYKSTGKTVWTLAWWYWKQASYKIMMIRWRQRIWIRSSKLKNLKSHNNSLLQGRKVYSTTKSWQSKHSQLIMIYRKYIYKQSVSWHTL
jgi:hypothetical protein